MIDNPGPRRIATAIVLALVIGVAPAAAPVGAAAGACPGNEGVTVVVDFTDLGGGSLVACAPSPVATGLAALTGAGIEWTPTARFAQFVCRIEGLPAEDPCVNTPPASAYWTYWVASRGGPWCYATVGAASRTPPPGSVEGWSFAKNRPAGNLPAPRVAPPPPSPGSNPAPLPSCPPPAPVTTSAPAATTPAATSPVPTTPVASTPVATTPVAPGTGSSQTSGAIPSTSTSGLPVPTSTPAAPRAGTSGGPTTPTGVALGPSSPARAEDGESPARAAMLVGLVATVAVAGGLLARRRTGAGEE